MIDDATAGGRRASCSASSASTSTPAASVRHSAPASSQLTEIVKATSQQRAGC